MKNHAIFAVFMAALITSVFAASTADAQSVLRVSRGLTSNNISVLQNRAVVLESAEPFLELSVAQPEIADVQPLSDRSLYIFGRGLGATTLTLLGENGRLITNVTVKVEPDLGELKERLKTLLPKEPIEVRSAGDGLVLSGVVSGKAKVDRAMSLARAYVGNRVTNMMSVGGTQQVNLRVRIAEIDRSAAKELGFNVQARGSTARAGVNAVSGGQLREPEDGVLTSTPREGALAPGLVGGLFENVVSFGSFGALFSIADTFILDLRLNALESKGFSRNLAEPNVVALSGQQASLLVGGEAPVPVADNDNDVVTVEFRPIGVNMNFVPTVLDDDLINIEVSAEVSSIDPAITVDVGETTVFGFEVRRATTTVELRDGQSFAIAGLYESNFSDVIDQVPFLGTLPVIGTLFRSTNFQRGETELAIIITANLVVPVNDESQLALPTDRIQIPNEAELFLFGEPTGPSNGPARVAGQDFDGAYGYVLE